MAVGFFACPKAPPKVVEPPKVLEPAEAVRETMEKAYRAVEAGDGDQLEALFADDALVFGLGPSDTWLGGMVVGERSRQALLPLGLGGDSLKIEDSRLVVGLASGETAAWVFDLPRVVTTHKGKTERWLPRLTAHLTRDGARWRIDALHVSLPVPDQLVFAPDAQKRLIAPADVTNERSPDADQLVGLVRRALDDYGVKIERTSERPEFVQLGTSATEIFIDGKVFKELIKPQLGAIKKAGYSWKLDGNLRVKLAPGGKSGWAAAIVVQRVGSGRKAQVFPAFRFLWTLVEEDGVWNISSEHQSLAVKEELRDPATDEQLKTWKDVRELAEKTMAKSKPTKPPAKPEKAPEAREPEKKPDIGVW
ncbi:MAG: nuclear transport factor 2 family protein [Myxococcota bacterium]